MPKKWEQVARQKRHEEHMRRIREMKPSVDDKPPKQLFRDGRKVIERDRILSAVEKDNRLLLDRLGKAMETKNIDNYAPPVKFASVQEENRKKTLKRVTADNIRLLNRIQNAEPQYRAIEWERDAEQREKYLATMTEFPDRYVPKFTPSKQFQRAKRYFLDSQGDRAHAPGEAGAGAGGMGAGMGMGMGMSPPHTRSPLPPIRFSSPSPEAAAAIQPPSDSDPGWNGLQRPITSENLRY